MLFNVDSVIATSIPTSTPRSPRPNPTATEAIARAFDACSAVNPAGDPVTAAWVPATPPHVGDAASAVRPAAPVAAAITNSSNTTRPTQSLHPPRPATSGPAAQPPSGRPAA